MRTQFFIFIRPPGSHMWTLDMKHHGIPWTSFDANIANDYAQELASTTKFCAMVVTVQTPKEPDTGKYALLADGDTKFTPT